MNPERLAAIIKWGLEKQWKPRNEKCANCNGVIEEVRSEDGLSSSLKYYAFGIEVLCSRACIELVKEQIVSGEWKRKTGLYTRKTISSSMDKKTLQRLIEAEKQSQKKQEASEEAAEKGLTKNESTLLSFIRIMHTIAYVDAIENYTREKFPEISLLDFLENHGYEVVDGLVVLK